MENKKTVIVAIVAIALVALISGTYAYFTSTATVQNNYSASSYETVVERTLGGLNGIQPGDYIYFDTLKVKNQGSNTIGVRAKISGEYFIEEANKAGLTGASKETVAAAATLSMNTINNNRAMQPIYGADWIYSSDGWYYYNGLINSNAQTATNFINGLYFNSAATNNSNCYYATLSEGNYIIDQSKKNTPVDSLESNNVICVSESEQGQVNYANADYKLYVTFETIQGSAVNSVWGANIPASATNLISQATTASGESSKIDPEPLLGFQPIYFAYGTPTTSDTVQPAGHNIFGAMDGEENKGICIIRGGTTHCFKINDVAFEVNHAQQVFSDVTCNTGNGDSASCIATDFYIFIRSNGSIMVRDYGKKESCNATTTSIECSSY